MLVSNLALSTCCIYTVVVHVVTEGWFTVAEIFPGSISAFHKWFDGWTFCILDNFFILKIILQYVKFLILSVIVRFSRLNRKIKY